MAFDQVLVMAAWSAITIVISTVLSFLLFKRAAKSIITSGLAGFQSLITRGAKAISAPGVEARQLKAAEAKVLQGAIDNIPELQVGLTILEQFAPEVAEQIRENPRLGIALYQRLAPMIQGFMQKGGGMRANPKAVEGV